MRLDARTILAPALRVSLGWFMFFAGIEKVLNPAWTAAGFLAGAKTFPEFYGWFALAQNAWWVDPLNAWGITLVGVAFILGIGLRQAALVGVILMILYYFPHFDTLPWIPHGFIVEEHIIYAIAFLLVAVMPEARRFSIAAYVHHSPLMRFSLVRWLV